MIKNCLTCGKEFEPEHPVMAFCSIECRANRPTKYQSGNKLRFRVFTRDNFSCVYCGRNSTDDGIKLNAEHLIARNGYNTTLDNLVTSCSECNGSKGKIPLSDENIAKIQKVIAERNKLL